MLQYQLSSNLTKWTISNAKATHLSFNQYIVSIRFDISHIILLNSIEPQCKWSIHQLLDDFMYKYYSKKHFYSDTYRQSSLCLFTKTNCLDAMQCH